MGSGAPPAREFDSLIVWEEEMGKSGGPGVPVVPQRSDSLIVWLAFEVSLADSARA